MEQEEDHQSAQLTYRTRAHKAGPNNLATCVLFVLQRAVRSLVDGRGVWFGHAPASFDEFMDDED
eukprot:271199-Amphidinium_carterae.1